MIIYQDVKSNRGDYHRNEPIFVLYIGTELKDQEKNIPRPQQNNTNTVFSITSACECLVKSLMISVSRECRTQMFPV